VVIHPTLDHGDVVQVVDTKIDDNMPMVIVQMVVGTITVVIVMAIIAIGTT
jgi:hypothetical protein